MTYAQEYQQKRRTDRLVLARQWLGGVCVQCGTDERLEFDHIDPRTKVCEISTATNWSLERFLTEVDKCQLLCRPHHVEKSNVEQGVEHGGGVQGKRGCKCAACKEAKRAYMRAYAATRGIQAVEERA